MNRRGRIHILPRAIAPRVALAAGAILRTAALAIVLAAVLAGREARAGDDPFLHYVRSAPEFRPVPLEPPAGADRWETWLYMPWPYHWTIGFGEEGGRFCLDHGIRGGVVDHAQGPLDWLERFGLRFYVDHLAGKGDLFLIEPDLDAAAHDPRAIRSGRERAGGPLVPLTLDAARLERLLALVEDRARAMRESPMRVAYALDDEASWGSFVRPIAWRIHDDDAAYARWLHDVRGLPTAAPRFVTPDALAPEYGKPLAAVDFSPLLDRLSYNDSVFAAAVGTLVERANAVDPTTPCGLVGCQAPSPFGGYDYAKLARKMQFAEAYDLGSAPEILRSLDPAHRVPIVTTHFHSPAKGVGNDAWQAWSGFAHGRRGMIGWIDGWFDGAVPRPWIEPFARTLRELTRVQGPKLIGARWIHDGIAIYYSHPSVQVSWCLDVEPHGRTWPRRNEDHRLGTAPLVRKAWELMLNDAGLQYDFLAYDTAAREGIPDTYRVLILPACYALSDIEARHIREWCARGGTVIADFATGLFDERGRGRERGVLDDLFGVRHDGTQTRGDWFGPGLWVETNQEKGYGHRTFAELFATSRARLFEGFAVAERQLPVQHLRRHGRGRAIWLNLSPQRYLLYREEGRATDAHRETFLRALRGVPLRPWVRILVAGGPQGAAAHRPRDVETTAWSRAGRTWVLAVQNPLPEGSSRGGTGASDLREGTIEVDVVFAGDVKDVVDERTGKRLGDGRRFHIPLDLTEAVFLSFQGPPPRP